MLNPEFVKILVCPENRTPVRVASDKEILDLNLKIEEVLDSVGLPHRFALQNVTGSAQL